jgi:hypothetical protein
MNNQNDKQNISITDKGKIALLEEEVRRMKHTLIISAISTLLLATGVLIHVLK